MDDVQDLTRLCRRGLLGVGTSAAVCNAIFHATGSRIRELPVRIEKLLQSA